MFEIIKTPFSPVKTVRLNTRGDFRPCSTGVDIEELKVRTLMERAEEEYTNNRGVIASAAHADKDLAIENAYQEAIERISLAAWWKYRRPAIAKLSDERIGKLLEANNITKPANFSVDIGFVESVDPDYYVTYSIISNRQSYPFAVLGGGCSKDTTVAAKKALYESIQSWTATQWIDSHEGTKSKVYWDISELEYRSSLPVDITTALDEKITTKHKMLSALNVRAVLQGDLYIAEATEKNKEFHTASEMAKLAMKDGEKNVVFTPYNL